MTKSMVLLAVHAALRQDSGALETAPRRISKDEITSSWVVHLRAQAKPETVQFGETQQ
jgi:hypothetical protein